VLIVFDRWFGTFAEANPDHPLRYGLVHPLGTRHPVRIAFGEWRRLFADMRMTRSLRGAMRVALGRP
jgi:sterol desaturase/sphingolipid hydroxylase (fatty acid hydroxylase superfamily)